MGGGQPSTGRDEHPQDLVPAALLRLEPALEGVALHQLHRHEHAVLPRAHVVDGDDVRVRELGEGLGLLQQSPALALLLPSPVAVGRAHQLERDLAVELGVVGREHQAHAARADRFEHDVASQPSPRREPGFVHVLGHQTAPVRALDDRLRVDRGGACARGSVRVHAYGAQIMPQGVSPAQWRPARTLVDFAPIRDGVAAPWRRGSVRGSPAGGRGRYGPSLWVCLHGAMSGSPSRRRAAGRRRFPCLAGDRALG